jgi:hypothetical protein
MRHGGSNSQARSLNGESSGWGKGCPYHEVGFDLYLNAIATNKQFGFIRVGAGDGSGLKPVGLRTLRDLSKSFGDLGQRFRSGYRCNPGRRD